VVVEFGSWLNHVVLARSDMMTLAILAWQLTGACADSIRPTRHGNTSPVPIWDMVTTRVPTSRRIGDHMELASSRFYPLLRSGVIVGLLVLGALTGGLISAAALMLMGVLALATTWKQGGKIWRPFWILKDLRAVRLNEIVSWSLSIIVFAVAILAVVIL